LIDIKTNPDLYSLSNDQAVRRSLDFAKHLSPSKGTEQVIFHYYWRVPREFSRKQVLPLKSAIVTQHSRPSRIILWSNVELTDNPFIKPLLPFIECRIWSLEKEIKGTPIENSNINKGPIDDTLCWLGGDLFRLLCLYKYGGVYMDMDVVALRDLGPLLDYEFMYQWGSSGTTEQEPNMMINGAVMRLFPKSKLATDLLVELNTIPATPNSNCWGRDLYAKVRNRNNDWCVFPCAWFNTEWGYKPLKPFQGGLLNFGTKDLYDGAFTWHWHNQWDAKIDNGLKFAILEKIIGGKFEAMQV
jgi:hypothetical protein